MHVIASRLFAMIVTIVAAVAVITTGAGTAAAAPQTGEMFLTFVRHGESTGNASGLIDTSIPGPSLTDKGWKQSEAVAELLDKCKFDGLYASRMIRTQETATPLAEECDSQVLVEEGFHEIEAGIYEGTPQEEAIEGYLAAPIQWVQGNLDARIPGSINGHEFKQRMDDSIQNIKDNGDKRAVIFSHGGAMMFWALMSLPGLDLSKLQTDPIHNTGRIVVKGTPSKGWKLHSWEGSAVG